ncbi:hypothetical protein DUT91_23655 [Phyllobacterium salinisoli]|uniref:Uncharacterized protein n=1 Tax=Phyllobacterium salinisoli TaxID=1899321 RepID=A0A368JX22_9HYPH|nr:hypothetical protein [Phyllobacterium salinisoli]RCS21501.1 hypothetical protein DUT91_23655 [Phyllobacterium salinisoli]
MPVARIERMVAGVVKNRVERGADGAFACHQFDSNVHPVALMTLDDVANYLRANPRSGVRMNPGWVKISRNIHIDGVLLR